MTTITIKKSQFSDVTSFESDVSLFEYLLTRYHDNTVLVEVDFETLPTTSQEKIIASQKNPNRKLIDIQE